MRWPGGLPPGERRGQVVNLVDVTATILDALGAPPLENADGVSFLDVARDKNAPWKNITYSEYCAGSAFDFTIPGATTQNRMVRDGDLKLCYYHRLPSQLFDLRNDPDEQHDLAGDPRYRQVQKHLTELVLDGWHPEEIERRIESRIADKKLMQAWAMAVRPESRFIWQMKAEYNVLDPVET
jgi:choline-sulfatase